MASNLENLYYRNFLSTLGSWSWEKKPTVSVIKIINYSPKFECTVYELSIITCERNKISISWETK